MLSLADGDWIESKDQSNSGYRLIQTGNIGEGIFETHIERARFISPETFCRLKCTEVFAGDCLISRLPDPIGRACILPDVNTRMITAVDCAIARPVDGKIDMRFFVYYTSTSDYKGQMERSLMGSTRQRISRKSLNDVTISLPDVNVQKEIVSSLSAIDTQISNLQSLVLKYEAIKKATVKLLLTPKKGWQEKSLGALAFIKTGGRNTQDATASGRYPFFVRSPNVERIDTYSYDGEAILVAGDGVGAGKVFHYINGKHDCHQRVYRIRDFHPEVMGRFIYCVLSEQFPSYMERRNDKASVDSLRLPAFKSFPVFYPDVNEQKRIVTILDSINDTISELRAQLAKSQSIKQGMMTYFFG